VQSPRFALVLLAASAAPAHAFVLDAWTQESCAAYSYTEDFDITGCHLGPGIVGSIVTKTNASPGDAFASINPSADLEGNAVLPATLDHNGVDGSAADEANLHAAVASAAALTLTLRNESAGPAALDFGFKVDTALVQLELEDFVADGDDIPIADVTAEIWCETCAQDKLAWHYRALYASYNNANPFGVVNDLLDFLDPHGVGKPTWTSVDGGNQCSLTPPFDCTHEAHATLSSPFQGTIPIGSIDPGASATIRYTIRARVYTGALDPGQTPTDPPRAAGVAFFSDPFGVGEVVFVNGTPLSTLVPEAEPAVGSVTAVAALGAGARWRGRRRPAA
jgi:hypothetical protein